MATQTVNSIVVGSTYKFQGTFSKDGTTWDITGGTVTLTIHSPDGTSNSLSATLSDPTNGVADYTNSSSLFDVSGRWERSWLVTVSGTILESDVIPFTVINSP